MFYRYNLLFSKAKTPLGALPSGFGNPRLGLRHTRRYCAVPSTQYTAGFDPPHLLIAHLCFPLPQLLKKELLVLY